jgi:ribonuclease HIII
MPLDTEKLIIEIHADVKQQGAHLSRLLHKLEGNGQPGLFQDFIKLRESHEECQRQKEITRENALREADSSLKKAVAVASIVATLLSALIGKLL